MIQSNEKIRNWLFDPSNNTYYGFGLLYKIGGDKGVYIHDEWKPMRRNRMIIYNEIQKEYINIRV